MSTMTTQTFDAVQVGDELPGVTYAVQRVNLVMYALCLDYKDDAVHLPVIMNRRR